ncbi:MAG: hypothetical protein PF542_03300 [Nanoarchaeota archaeon]|nr:hypothetical protein [Nanoarchaeota archaeon]
MPTIAAIIITKILQEFSPFQIPWPAQKQIRDKTTTKAKDNITKMLPKGICKIPKAEKEDLAINE